MFSQSLKLLSVMAAIRLEEETDNIGNTLALALIESKSGGAANKSITSSDPLASSSWDEVIIWLGALMKQSVNL